MAGTLGTAATSEIQLRHRKHDAVVDTESSRVHISQEKHKRPTIKLSRNQTVATVVIVVCLLLIGLSSYRYLTKKKSLRKLSKSEVYKSAAVASDAKICSIIGRDILKRNGNAVDSAIATLLCVGIANFHSLGLGGGFSATVFDNKTKEVITISARETAPLLSTSDVFNKDPKLTQQGGLSICVPGELKGYWALHQRFGRLPWAELFQPTIDLCEKGFPIAGALRRAFKTLLADDPPRVSDAIWDKIHDKNTGEFYNIGDVIKRPKFAETLRQIAIEGGESFYTGNLSKSVLKELKEAGSLITAEDLRNYEVKWMKPASVTLKDGVTVYAPPLPHGGPILTLMLDILDRFDFDNQSMSTYQGQVLTYHRMVEAMKFAHTFKTEMGDPDFMDTSQLDAILDSGELAQSMRDKITDDHTHGTDYYGWTPYDQIKTGTGHLSVVDEEGNAVSITSTLNQYFGSNVVGKNTDIIYNCVMDDFAFINVTNRFGVEPSITNYLEPGKRPLSSTCPTILLNADKTIKMAIGGAGGSKIPTILAQVIVNVLRFGRTLTEAVNSPRFHHQLLPKELNLEGRFSKDIMVGLMAKGHMIAPMPLRGNVVQAILVEGSDVIAIADHRKGGKVAGY